MDYQQIKSRFDELVQGEPEYLLTITHNKLQGVLIGVLEAACGGKENRKLVQIALTGKSSSRDFTTNEWYAMFRFCFPIENGAFQFKDMADKWAGREELNQWCRIILDAKARQEGQTEMFDKQKVLVELGFRE